MSGIKNNLEPEDIEWKFVTSLALTNCHHAKYVNEQFGLEKEVLTRKNGEFGFGKSKTYYFITGSQKEYTDLSELCKDWNEMKNFDDPNNEIVWIKTIKTKE